MRSRPEVSAGSSAFRTVGGDGSASAGRRDATVLVWRRHASWSERDQRLEKEEGGLVAYLIDPARRPLHGQRTQQLRCTSSAGPANGLGSLIVSCTTGSVGRSSPAPDPSSHAAMAPRRWEQLRRRGSERRDGRRHDLTRFLRLLPPLSSPIPLCPAGLPADRS